MSNPSIDASLNASDVQAVKDAFAAIVQKLPFLVNLTAEDRKSIFKTGSDSLSFVSNSSSAAQNYPNIFPASFDKAAFQKDVELFAVLTEISTLADSVASSIDDTRLAVGGEAMQQATQVYNYVKTAAKTTTGLKPIADQLGERFQKASKQKETPKPHV